MTIQRVTISMPQKLARRAKKAAGKQPVSAWMTKLVEDHLTEADLERLWQDFYASVAPSRTEERRAAARVTRLTKPRRRRAA